MVDFTVDDPDLSVGQLALDRRSVGLDDARRHELRHEAHTALLGIEAATVSLTDHRHLMTPEEVTKLSAALVAEVQRLHGLLDRSLEGRGEEAAPFVLRGALEPVVACVRATGLDVDLQVPQRLRVQGVAAHTAQVVRSLLENVIQHAPGALVTIGVVVDEDHVTVRVADTGPGIATPIREGVFERGVRAADSDGSGLGLYVARRLMADQGGSIWIDSKQGAGTSVFVRLPRPAVTERLYAVT